MTNNQQPTHVYFFPGKGMPLKRYKPYFQKKICLHDANITPPPRDEKIYLCHSRGLHDAIAYCLKVNVRPILIAMDGTTLTTAIPNNLFIIQYRPQYKQGYSDETFYKELYFYSLPGDDTNQHYPYQHKVTRDRIVQRLLKEK